MNRRDEEQSLSLTDSVIGDSTEIPQNSQCSSYSDREENFESYGENDDVEYENDVDVESKRTSPYSDSRFTRRNTWFRTSLRKSPGYTSNGSSNSNELSIPPRRYGSFRHSTKRLGSNALASALYHGYNGNSATGSIGDDGDMQSDISLEEDVNDLNQQVQMLQHQVGHLAENQASTDDKYTKVKQDNTALTARIHMLEETIRELEIRSQERLDVEVRRNKELIHRLEREKQLEIENYSIRLQAIEKEHNQLANETNLIRSQSERLKSEKRYLEDSLTESQNSFASLSSEHSKLTEYSRKELESIQTKNNESTLIISELYKEINGLRRKEQEVERKNQEGSSMEKTLSNLHPELEIELRNLRDENHSLKESNEELQAQMLNRGLEEGKNLLLKGHHDDSLAAEFEAMNENEIRNALKEQQEVNASLRRYIDGILMAIMEKYPELLEVRK